MAYTTIDKPTDYFNTVLYTGDGNDGRTVTGVGFQPDFVWIKPRSNASSHTQVDSVRGANGSVMRTLFSNITDAEESTTSDTNLAYGVVNSIDSDGFTVGSGVTADGRTNQSGQTYASWNWLAGGTASSNTDGSITSSVSANTTAGFSIVSFTGTGADATVGHGLNVAPDMVIVKSRDAARNWGVYHRSLGGDDSLKLNLTDATTTSLDCWNDLDPTSTVVHLGTTGGTNVSGEDAIMYCFHSVKGFSKFGSYIGNGNADGTFVYTGFKPAFLITKEAVGTGGNWQLYDNKRDTINPNSTVVLPNTTNADITTSTLDTDFLSNGFKLRNTDVDRNQSGDTYIYMAFAENPFVTSTGIPTTAR